MSKLDEADLALLIGKACQVPMSMIDGRPWVPTEVEVEVEVDEGEWD